MGSVHSHARARFAFIAEGETRVHSGILERTVALVAIKFIGLRIVGDQQVGPSAASVVEHCDPQRLRTAVENAAGGRDVLKSSVAAIVKQPAGLAAIRLGCAIRLVLAVEAAEHIAPRRPLHVVADKQIEQAIAIVVEPQSRGAESLTLAESTGNGRVQKRSFASVPKQTVLAYTGDEDVGKAVVVVITDSYAHAVEFNVETGARGHVSERAVAVVVIEPESRALRFVVGRIVICGFVAGPVHAVDQQNVLPAVTVVVKERAARAQGLGEKFTAVSSAVVLEVNTGRFCHIDKTKSRTVARTGLSQRTNGQQVTWERMQQRQMRARQHTRHSLQKRPALHGTFTSPARMA